MPGIVTHHAFGVEVYGRLAGVIGEGEEEREAFLLGNLGPDPFFFLQIVPRAVMRKDAGLRGIGSMMHRDATDELLCSVHENMVRNGSRNRSVAAYGFGFLCHYLLDSTVHPLVYAQQHAICAAEDGWLGDAWMPRVVHSTIETEYDEYVFTTRLDATVASMPPHREMLRCPPRSLAAISGCMSQAIRSAYGKQAPARLFYESVVLFRMAQLTLDAKSTGLRSRFDYLRPLGFSTAYTNALAHVNERRDGTVFANGDHVAWPSAFADGLIVSDDFDSLYALAFERALEVVPRYAQESFGLDDCRAMTSGVNFLGREMG